MPTPTAIKPHLNSLFFFRLALCTSAQGGGSLPGGPLRMESRVWMLRLGPVPAPFLDVGGRSCSIMRQASQFTNPSPSSDTKFNGSVFFYSSHLLAVLLSCVQLFTSGTWTATDFVTPLTGVTGRSCEIDLKQESCFYHYKWKPSYAQPGVHLLPDLEQNICDIFGITGLQNDEHKNLCFELERNSQFIE